MNFKTATYQQLAVICWDDPTATWKEQAEARAEMWRRVRPAYKQERVNHRLKAVYR
jgi:hypothetical protein